MSYKDDNEAYELKQRQIDAMEQALLIARGISRAESAEIVAERKRLQDAYRGTLASTRNRVYGSIQRARTSRVECR